jgi:hypothetical protein
MNQPLGSTDRRQGPRLQIVPRITICSVEMVPGGLWSESMVYLADEVNDPVTLEDLEARLDDLQTTNEFLAERLRHIEHALVLCFMLLVLITTIELQLLSMADLREKGQQLWNWLFG